MPFSASRAFLALGRGKERGIGPGDQWFFTSDLWALRVSDAAARPLADAVHSFTLSQQSYESFFILMSFSGNWVFPMRMAKSLIDAALLVPLVNVP